MATSPITFEQLGRAVKAKYPDYASKTDAEVGQAAADKYPEYGATIPGSKNYVPPMDAPSKGAKAIVDSGPTTRTGAIVEGIESNPAAQHVPTRGPRSLLQNLGAGAGDAVTGAYHEFDGKPAPPDPTIGMTPEQRLQYHADQVSNQGEAQTKAFFKDPIGAYTSHIGEQLPALVVGGAIHAATPAIAEGTATGLNTGGRILKKMGAGVSKVAVGAPAAVDNLGASTGRALASNRIVGISKRSLARKVEGKIGPAVEARDTVLRNSDAPPTDVAPLVRAPFDDISEVKTDPKTGAVRPGGIRRMAEVRRAIQEVQDPETGELTGQPKDSNLTPAEMGRMQTNVYDMADYENPDSDLANQYTKEVGARLKGAINEAAPEAQTSTDNIHDLLGAKSHLQTTAPGPVAGTNVTVGRVLGRAYDAARIGGGTTAGAALDIAGSGMKRAGGVLRSLVGGESSPVAPNPQPAPRRTPLLEANTPTDATVGPEDLTGAPGAPQRPPITTPPPAPPLALGRGTPETGPNTHPGTPGPGARTRVAPTEFADRPAPTPKRGLIADPDGTVRPEPYPLGSGAPAPPQLESRTGPRAPSARPALIRQLRNEAGVAGVADTMDREGAVEAGRRKLIETPEGLPEQPDQYEPTTHSLINDEDFYHGTQSAEAIAKSGELRPGTGDNDAGGKGVFLSRTPEWADLNGKMNGPDESKATVLKVRMPRKSLVRVDEASQGSQIGKGSVFSPKPIPTNQVVEGLPEAAAPTSDAPPARLPNRDDMDGWMALMDKGWAEYDARRAEFTYTGPTVRKSLTKP